MPKTPSTHLLPNSPPLLRIGTAKPPSPAIVVTPNAKKSVLATPKKRSPPVLSQHALELRHSDIAARIEAYRHRNYRNKVVLPKWVWDTMEMRNAKYLHANNIHSRNRFAMTAADVLSPFFLDEVRPLFWITLTPGQFAFDFEEACTFDVNRLIKWTQQVLRGLSLVGMVEAGCFPVPHASHSKINISFHVHLLGWGVTAARLQEIKDRVNAKYKSLVQWSPVMDVRQKSPAEAIKRVFYMTKAPLSEMRPVGMLQRTDPDTGVVFERGTNTVFKRPIRTGHYANMCLATAALLLDKLAFSAGEGNALLKEIRAKALSEFNNEERRREAWRMSRGLSRR